jgi:hypothetical protein
MGHANFVDFKLIVQAILKAIEKATKQNDFV